MITLFFIKKNKNMLNMGNTTLMMKITILYIVLKMKYPDTDVIRFIIFII